VGDSQLPADARLVIWIVLQPNMSTSIVILVIWFVLWWAAGMRIRHLLYFAAIGAVIVAISIPALPILKKAKVINDYQIKRITNFIHPASEAEARYGDRYNTDQAEISIGSGGLAGRGMGRGRKPNYVISSALVRLHLRCHGRRIRFAGVVAMMVFLLFVIFRCLRAGAHRPRHIRGADRLRGCHPDRFSGFGKHGGKSQVDARHRFAIAVHQLRRQLAAFAATRHRAGRGL